MKTLLICTAAIILGCSLESGNLVNTASSTRQSDSANQPDSKTDGQVKSTARIEKLTLSIGRAAQTCVVSYREESSDREQGIVLDLAPPCEFMRNPATLVPLSYSYGKKTKKHVLIVSGGPPDETVTDQFMPQGCGTEFQAISIVDSKVRISKKVGQEGGISTHCPSGGLDEMYFSYYSSD